MNILKAFISFWRRLERGRAVLLLSGIGLSLIMAVVYAIRPIFFVYLDTKLYDSFFRWEHSQTTSGVPVIVDIDDASLQQLGQWPWPRYRIAKLLNGIKELGAESIGLDMVFSEQDRTSLNVLQEELLEDYNMRINFQGLPESMRDNDFTLAQTLKSGPFVLGYHFDFGDNKKFVPKECALHKLNLSIMRGPDSSQPQDVVFNAPHVICNLKSLGESVSHSGFFNALPDPDGTIRHAPLLIEYKGNYYPCLALATYLQAYPTKQIILWLKRNEKADQEPPSLQVGETIIPLSNSGQLLINFRGPRESFPYYSAADILMGRLPPNILENKIVFIGTSAAGLKDIRATPLDQIYPGVEVHATVLDNILREDFRRQPDVLKDVEVLLVFGLGLLSTVLMTWSGALWSLLPLCGCAGGLWYGSLWAFGNKGVFISPLIPSITLAVNFALLTLMKFWREESEKRFYHAAFSQYVSKAVVEQIVKSPEKLSLSGEERIVSILFSDIRSFTSMSEKLTPHQVSELLQAYFTPMTAIITEQDGTLDKFIGDAIMAFWNAPLDTSHHQQKAVFAAMNMHTALEKLNPMFMERFGLELHIGVGLHCGMVRVGNMGSKDLFDYTIIGDSVNLASRLEGLTKFYGQGVVVSETIRNACQDASLYFQELDTVRVKGKALPIMIYTPHHEETHIMNLEEFNVFEQALAAYKKQDFRFAQECLTSLRTQFHDRKLYALYQERCARLAKNPPGEGWDHVFTHESK